MIEPEVRRIDVGSITLSVTLAGAGAPLLLLHGFPDRASLWREQIPPLVDAGFRIVAPDLRGFGDSDAPDEVQAYRLERILDDLGALLEALDIDVPVTVIGHDWGALVGWLMAATRPARVKRFAALSVGHPEAFKRAGLRQLARSWYVFAFQWRGVAERMLQRRNFRMLAANAPTREDAQRWRRDLRRSGRLTAGLNWYRANISGAARGAVPAVDVPVLGLYSDGDPALTERQMTGSARYVTGSWEYHRIEGAGHWLQIERPTEVNALLLAWLERI